MATTFRIRASLTQNATSCRSEANARTKYSALSQQQVKFAEKNHRLVYAFLSEQHLDPDEYYDLAAVGYLRAVMRYCSHAYLRRFSFSTVAFRAMQQSIASWRRSEARRRQAEDAYCTRFSRTGPICSAELSEEFYFSELQRCGTAQQVMLASLRRQGLSVAEIAAQCQLSPQRVRRMLKSLHSAYLRLHWNAKEAKQ